MKRILLPIAFAFILAACSNKKTEPPKDVLPEDKLIDLLIDIRLLEGAYSVKYREVDTSDFKVDAYYKKLFQEKGITKEQFEKSYAFYSNQDGKMPEIENKIMERFSEMQAKLEVEK